MTFQESVASRIAEIQEPDRVFKPGIVSSVQAGSPAIYTVTSGAHSRTMVSLISVPVGTPVVWCDVLDPFIVGSPVST